MKPIDPDGFEKMFQVDPDPWNYVNSPFEAYKRGVLLRACGSRQYGRVLELACANGETTTALRGRALRLLAIDASPTAIAAAKRRTAGLDRIVFRVARLPGEMPCGPFDLIVVSELLYYLPHRAFRQTMSRLEEAMAPGGKIVLLHHLRNFDDASQPPRLVHARAKSLLRRRMRISFHEHHGRFEAIAFDAGRGR